MKLLVCDDDIMIAKAIEFRLSRENYEITFAADGLIASDKVRNEDFDLIIIDLLMPFFSGFEMIQLVRNELKKNTPMIVLSKLSDEDHILEAFKLGADDYITKPFSPNELSVRIKRFLIKK